MTQSPAIILGCGPTVWEDFTRSIHICPTTPAIFAVNDMVMHFPKEIHCAVSLHPEILNAMLAVRRLRFPHLNYPLERARTPDSHPIANSGMAAVYWAHQEGFHDVYLCGMSFGRDYYYTHSDTIETFFSPSEQLSLQNSINSIATLPKLIIHHWSPMAITNLKNANVNLEALSL